jgi:hypothetical protein
MTYLLCVTLRDLSTWFALASLCSTVAVRAQHPALAPMADTTIVVPSGPLNYSSILIPAGVTVRFVAPGGVTGLPGSPALVRCDGDAVVHGTISVAGDYNNGRAAGWSTTATGAYGRACGWFYFGPPNWPPQGGRHAQVYGSAVPFDLEGGSRGGIIQYFANLSCNGAVSYDRGGEGGGTLALQAGGRIEVHGTITADGEDYHAGGSGGSILLRGDGGVQVMPGASVTARGGWGPTPPAPNPPNYTLGAPGYIRFDAWGTAPVIQGTIDPPPTVIELPHLRSLSQPSIGTNWTMDVFAPEGSWVYVAAASAPANTMTQFGQLGLDLAFTAGVAQSTALPSHDPFVNVQWAIPNVPQAIGMPLWIQAIALPPGLLPTRLTNTLAVTVQ